MTGGKRREGLRKQENENSTDLQCVLKMYMSGDMVNAAGGEPRG